jgi:isoleucyl-tRNA synthetase
MKDTLDVWFDSGTDALARPARLACRRAGYPADLYLEGSDQHRGWFQSSLLSGCAIDGRAPYKALLTHGFVVDGKGHKMSKSKGNVIAPQKVSDKLGADILRLWTASTDYSGELSISDEILKRVVEGYRRIRNTLRFLLANTSDFDPAKDMLPVEQWLEIDRYALAMTRELQAQLRSRLRPLRIPPRRPGAADLLLGRSRRLLPRHPQGPPVHHGARIRARRSAQARCGTSLQAFVKLMAPILLHRRRSLATAERRRRAVGDAPAPGTLPKPAGRGRTARQVGKIRTVRAEVTKALEELREAGKIGSSLQAEVELHCDGEKYDLLASLGDDLKFVLICSRPTLVKRRNEGGRRALDARQVRALLACARGRRRRCRASGLCGRCVSNLHGEGEARRACA